jgi:death-on-curing protein
MITIKKEQALRLHTFLVRETGGDAGVRDHSLLESALAAPLQTFGGE